MAFASSLPKLASALLLPLLVLASLTVTRGARAQSIDPILNSGLDRSYSDRGANENPFWISYDDCINNDIMTFDVKVRNNAGYTLEVWAVGDGDCTVKDEREGDSPSCWLVFKERPSSIQLFPEIPVRNIVEQDNKGGDTVVPGTLASCNRETSAGGDNVTLWFMLVDGNGNVQGQGQQWATTQDLSGPNPPQNVEVSAGEERLQVSWDGNASTDLQNYELFCVPGTATASVPRYPLQASSDDAGVTDDAGATGGTGGTDGTGGSSGSSTSGGTSGSSTSGGTSGSSTSGGSGGDDDDDTGGSTNGMTACGVTTLVQGERPSNDLETCGTASRTGGTATGLINGVTYAVAVAGVDQTGNRGVLSNIVCGTPEIVDDFYELYERAGGKGGGGFCAFGSDKESVRGFGAALLVSLFGAALWFRRRAA